ncbi:iron complex transport system substrate-binding protein [Volucribacter psittacicida]|uniref:Iron complex transport system substrate-binding protein n=1 Tax=Volucribacter psittacicida TaxID=203482 RepID=A0A4V2PCN1_9PAST|nr:siderophore ABC transporter substrate-binding protein [Volucribacter psittacicida]TCK01876.1 iron complex transport system substrate-binding protein [Volucribacter psittacicida]
MKKMRLTLASLIGVFAVATAQANDVTVTTFVGEQVVPQNPQRVVVLDYAAADTMRELGVKDHIVGISKGMRMPAYLSEFQTNDNYANVGTLPEPAFEKINELNPDLIIASGRQEKVLDRLKGIAPVLFLKPDYEHHYESIVQNVLALGKVFDKEALAQEKVALLEKQISHLANQVAGKNALVILVNESNISAYGDTSRYAMVYQKFGFTPVDKKIKSSTHGMKVGFEYVAEQNPDYLLVVDRTAAITDKANNAQKTLDNNIIKQTNAYKNHHIVYLDAANWYLAFGGLESTAAMVKELEQAVQK